MDILDLLASDNYIPYNRTLAKELGIEPAILFGALCGYQRHYKMQEFFREQEKIIDDTCLTEYAIRQATKILQDKGLIIVKKKGLPAKNYYQINTTRLVEYLSTSGCENDTTGDCENNTTRNNENITTNNKIKNKTNNKINNNIKETTKEKKFTKPTLEEVQAYCKERNNNVDAERFIDFYTSKGWKVGNQPMKDWKACVRTWEKPNKHQAAPVEKKSGFAQHSFSKEELSDLFDDLDNVRLT